ncbi:MAG: anaerobic ribonucleoside-triphosphate reductase activating protein [Ruminococcaceae bacterium]|nr:anaerobic ribonucleoside-triphosphate reductase activating protein [Oscillospiraceae bacterium]
MLIAGFQKNSFVDYPGKIAAVVFTPHCNMRCWYCHNRHILGHDAELLDEQAVLEFLDRRKGALDAVVISGGEPTLRANLPLFIDVLRDMGYLVKLDTNGTNPKMLASLIQAGKLDYVAMDIKAPFEKYGEITQVKDDIAAIRQSATLLINGGIDYEFRTTFAPNLTPEDIGTLAREIQGAKRYYLQQYRPRDKEDPHSHTPEELNAAAECARAVLGDAVIVRGL